MFYTASVNMKPQTSPERRASLAFKRRLGYQSLIARVLNVSRQFVCQVENGHKRNARVEAELRRFWANPPAYFARYGAPSVKELAA